MISATSGTISRADLLRGRVTPTPEPIRPPFSLPEPEFRTLCEPCDACREACETDVIGVDGDGLPILLYGEAACTFCGACVEACPTGAMDADLAPPWTVTAHVKASCLSFNAITCRACEEACEAGAISFRLMTEGRSLPLVDETRCTGCGTCATICPNHAVDMRRSEPEEVLS